MEILGIVLGLVILVILVVGGMAFWGDLQRYMRIRDM